MRRSIVLVPVFLLVGCANEISFPDGDSSGSGAEGHPCAHRDEESCVPEGQTGMGECRRLYEGVSCENNQEFLGCVDASKFDCSTDADCASGESCETITSPYCPVQPGLASCLACGSRETHVCVP